MTLFAKIDGANNKVAKVIVAEQDFIDNQIGTWIECTNRQPQLNSLYDVDLDKFIPAQTYPSWTLNEAKDLWLPPTPRPTAEDNFHAVWNEATTSWDLVEN